MTLFNQNDYARVPYPSPSLPKQTVKGGGCGVCTSAVVLSYLGANYTIEALARIFIEKGARVEGGTDMAVAEKLICQLGKGTCKKTKDKNELFMHIRNGGIAIANVDGDKGLKGVFSSQGHYICVVGVKPDGKILVYDVADTPARYSSPYRANLVKREGSFLACDLDTLHKDTEFINNPYYLFSGISGKAENMNEKLDTSNSSKENWGKTERDKLVAKGVMVSEERYNENITRAEVFALLNRTIDAIESQNKS